MSSLPPNPRQGFAGLSATGTLTNPNQDPSFITPPGTGGRLRFALQAMDPICLKPSSNFLKFKGYLIVFGNYLCL